MPQDTGTPVPLSVLIEEAQKNNALILAAQTSAKAATYTSAQVSSLPDPQFTVQQVNVGSPRPFAGYTNSDFAYLGIGASQQLPYPGKLQLRAAVADRDAATLKAHVEVVAQDEIEKLTTSYIQLAYLQQTLGILQQNAALLQQVYEQATAHYSSGVGSLQEVLKSQLERTKVLRDISMHHQLVGDAEAELKRILKRPQGSPDIVTEPLLQTSLTYTVGELLEKVRDLNPEINESSAMIRRNQAAVDVAQKEFRPDFQLSYTYQNTDRKFRDYYMASVTVNFPRRKPREAALAQARIGVERAQQDQDVQLQQTMAEVQKQYVMVKASEEQLQIYRDGLVPQAKLASEAILSAYQSNNQDFASLLSSYSDLLNFNLEYQRTLLDHETALAHIERLTGVTLP
jgi:outer membrane protein, heavy metal efflux system